MKYCQPPWLFIPCFGLVEDCHSPGAATSSIGGCRFQRDRILVAAPGKYRLCWRSGLECRWFPLVLFRTLMDHVGAAPHNIVIGLNINRVYTRFIGVTLRQVQYMDALYDRFRPLILKATPGHLMNTKHNNKEA